MLVTRHTKDEAYFYSSRKKEMQMRRELESLRRKLRSKKGLPEVSATRTSLTKAQLEEMMTVEPPSDKERLAQRTAEGKGQKSLVQFGRERTSVPGALPASRRALSIGLREPLAEVGLNLEEKQLESADIVVSPRVAVAVRTVGQFIDEISDGSMFSTLGKLKHSYLHPILIVQGEPEGEGVQAGNAAVYDALSSLLAEYHMAVLSTRNPTETATQVFSLFKQEAARQEGSQKSVQTTLDVSTRQRFLVQGLPNVSATLAQRLLERFGSVKGIADADVEELMQVEGIGKVIAEGIHTVLRRKYGEEDG